MKESSNSDCLTPQKVKQYLQEELSEKASYQIENHLIDCPSCLEAIGAYVSTHHPEEASGASVSAPNGKIVV